MRWLVRPHSRVAAPFLVTLDVQHARHRNPWPRGSRGGWIVLLGEGAGRPERIAFAIPGRSCARSVVKVRTGCMVACRPSPAAQFPVTPR